jgi:serine/threonine protein phosphatase PrpC
MSTTILTLVAAAATDVGRVRRGNEDAYLVAPPVYAIADGMGGHRGGAVAAQLAVRILASHAADLASADGEALAEALAAANRAIVLAAEEDDALRGMATTCTAALVRGRVARIAHVGDSRAYLLHEGRLEQLTDDHSVVAQLVREGHLSPQDAAVHPGRSVIFRALGTGPDLEVDMVEVVLDADDRLLLCSDGLTGMLDDAEIAAILREVGDTGQAVEALVAGANAAGGVDNVTVVLVDVREQTKRGLAS